jgi:heat shock protein HtpX
MALDRPDLLVASLGAPNALALGSSRHGAPVLTGVGRGLVRVTGRPDNAALRVRAAIGALVGLVAFLVTASGRSRARRREFAADDRAAEVTGDPLALARALRKIERASMPRIGPFRLPLEREEHPVERLLSTHPPTDERVKRLAERARGRRVPIE